MSKLCCYCGQTFKGRRSRSNHQVICAAYQSGQPLLQQAAGLSSTHDAAAGMPLSGQLEAPAHKSLTAELPGSGRIIASSSQSSSELEPETGALSVLLAGLLCCRMYHQADLPG